MLAALLAIALTAPAAEPPEALPDRWLLKLVPADLPKLPDPFWKNTWYELNSTRGGFRWAEWTKFASGTDQKASETVLARVTGKDGAVTGYTALLAVHGVIVEFDGHLYTVALTERPATEEKTYNYLTLGAAVEVKPNVWYQAYSEHFADKKVRVTEILAEFAADPRKEKEGKAKVQSYVRMLDERKGERTEYAGEFSPARGQYGPAVLIAGKSKPDTVSAVRLELPTGEIPPRFDQARYKRLTAISEEVPKPDKPGPIPRLVQPPPDLR